MIKLGAKLVDIACMPIYLIAIASESANDLRGIIGDRQYVKGFNAGYSAAKEDFNA